MYSSYLPDSTLIVRRVLIHHNNTWNRIKWVYERYYGLYCVKVIHFICLADSRTLDRFTIAQIVFTDNESWIVFVASQISFGSRIVIVVIKWFLIKSSQKKIEKTSLISIFIGFMFLGFNVGGKLLTYLIKFTWSPFCLNIFRNLLLVNVIWHGADVVCR